MEARDKIFTTSSRKRYAVSPASSKELLNRDELRRIDRLMESSKGATDRVQSQPWREIPDLPFRQIPMQCDPVLGLAVQPIDVKESALDVPIRFIPPEEYRTAPLVDPPAHIPFARRVVALLKGVESVPMRWSRPLVRASAGRATVESLRDAETRAHAALRAGQSGSAARLLCCAASLHYNSGNTEMAISTTARALRLFEETGEACGVAYCENVLGVCYAHQGEFKAALLHHKRQEALGGDYATCVAQLNMGVCYAALGELEFAAQAFEDALGSGQAAGCSMLTTIAHGNAGLIAMRVGNMRAAQTHLEHSLEQCSLMCDKNGAAMCLLLLGEVYSLINDHPHALFYYEHAFRIGGEAGNTDIVNIARVSIGIATGNAMIRDVVLRKATEMGKVNEVQNVVDLLPP